MTIDAILETGRRTTKHGSKVVHAWAFDADGQNVFTLALNEKTTLFGCTDACFHAHDANNNTDANQLVGANGLPALHRAGVAAQPTASGCNEKQSAKPLFASYTLSMQLAAALRPEVHAASNNVVKLRMLVRRASKYFSM
jgi:hypothetical protein